MHGTHTASAAYRRFTIGVLAALLAVARQAPGQSGAWSSHGPEGATVLCLAADPSNPSVVYAGTTRGISKSLDGGSTWQPVGAGLPNGIVACIAIDSTASATLYAGTLAALPGASSTGIFKSTDGGQTWTAINSGLVDTASGSSPVDVETIAIDPHNPSTLLAGTRFSDIFKSTDGGATWQARTNGGSNVSLEVKAFQFHPSMATVYAASSQGLIRSTDGGDDWFYYGSEVDNLNSLVISPTNPGILYAGSADARGILRSTDGGSTFTNVSSGLPLTQGAFPFLGQIVFDPANSSILYAATEGGGIFKSANGTSWVPVSTGMRDPGARCLAFSGSSPSVILAGTFSGLYRSTDGAGNWATADSGLVQSSSQALVADSAAPGTLYIATPDGVHKTEDFGESWQEADSGLPLKFVSSLAITTGPSGGLYAGTLGGGLFQSSDGGANWKAVPHPPNDLYISSLRTDPSSPSTLYAGTAHPYNGTNPEMLYRSTDGGATWAATGLNAAGSAVDIIAVSPANAQTILVASAQARGYYQSLDGGKTWSTVLLDPTCGGINAFLFDASGATLYVAATAGLCRTIDGGTTWTLTHLANLANVTSLLYDPLDPSILIGSATPLAGGTGGVFSSTDGGQTWQPFGAGLTADATIESLAADSGGQVLYAGTSGMGVEVLPFVQARVPVKASSSRHRTRTVAKR